MYLNLFWKRLRPPDLSHKKGYWVSCNRYYWNLSPEKGYWCKTNILIRVQSDEIVQQHSWPLTLNKERGWHHVRWNLNSQRATWTAELVINRNNLGGYFPGQVNTSTNTKRSRNVGGFLYLKLKHGYTACQVRILSHIFAHWNIEVTLQTHLQILVPVLLLKTNTSTITF